MQRTRVDLPEPDRPMITKISPVRISSEASRTAPISPARALDRGGVGMHREEALDLRPEFPHPLAGELDRGVIPLRRAPEEYSLRAQPSPPGLDLPARSPPYAKHRRRTLSDQVAMRARLEVPDTVVSIGAAD